MIKISLTKDEYKFISIMYYDIYITIARISLVRIYHLEHSYCNDEYPLYEVYKNNVLHFKDKFIKF